jgi:hypothetical protein
MDHDVWPGPGLDQDAPWGGDAPATARVATRGGASRLANLADGVPIGCLSLDNYAMKRSAGNARTSA